MDVFSFFYKHFQKHNRKYLFIFAWVILVLVLIFAKQQNEGQLSLQRAEERRQLDIIGTIPFTDQDYVLGRRDSQIRVTIFFDLNCPYCKSFHAKILPLLLEEYPDVSFVYRHYPSRFQYKNAFTDAVVLECVRMNFGFERFWETIANMFEKKPNNFGPDKLVSTTQLFKADEQDVLRECEQSKEANSYVEEDLQLALRASIKLTPTTVISFAGESVVVPGSSYMVTRQVLDRMKNTYARQK